MEIQAENERLLRELAQVKTLYEQLLRKSQEEQTKTARKDDEYARWHLDSQDTIAQLQGKLENYKTCLHEQEAELERQMAESVRAREGAELERFRVVATERKKWEAREERASLIQQCLLEVPLPEEANANSPTRARLTAAGAIEGEVMCPDRRELDSYPDRQEMRWCPGVDDRAVANRDRDGTPTMHYLVQPGVAGELLSHLQAE